jgi:quinolinate synthase
VARRTGKEIITWPGSCEVHEKFTPEEIGRFRNAVPGLTVIAHPECPSEVLDASDYTGSTAQMIDFVEQKKPENILMVTECSMSDNLTSSFPDVNFIRPCSMCPHMKLITLGKVLKSMEDLGPTVEISNNVAERARFAVEQMLAVK